MRHFAAILIAFLLIHALRGNSGSELTIRYDVNFSGVDDKVMLAEFASVSNAVEFKERPPATLGLLERRARGDVPRLIEVLQSRGYYDPRVDVEIDEKAEPVVVTFLIEPGPLYSLKSVTVETVDKEPHAQGILPSVEAMGLEPGSAARARPILDAREIILNRVRGEGFPFVQVAEPKAIVDHSTREVSVSYLVNTGPIARFGSTSFKGLQSVERELLEGKLPWGKGAPYDPALLAEAQKRISETKLFSLVKVTHGDELDMEGLLPIEIEVTERKHRTIALGASYYTDEGPGAKASWEHRNIFGEGERLSLEAKASGLGVEGKATFQKPTFLRNDQSLLTSFRLGQDETDAFTSRSSEIGLTVEREPWKGLRFGAGPAFRLAQVDQQPGEEEDFKEFALVSFPAYLSWDTSDNLLDPSRGARLNVQLTPFHDTLDSELTFLKGYASYGRYFRLSERPSLILANRAGLGFMAGAERDEIPADLRFYAGGGGSIRGYPFQSVGPLLGDDPIGGRSIVELSTELRIKATETIGFVLFLDGGSAFESTFPDLSERLQWGTGTGLRYFTPFGPLRLDIAFPLNPRESVDDPFQIYVSIGQAF